jgi:6-pyruvoyltetrahydropterin/6-carboxytetrahydropterin synthase
MGSTAFRQWKAKSHCRLIHGYRLQCKLWFSAESLDDNNWVYDFGGCKEIKKILEKQFDHTTCVAEDDPELVTFKELNNKLMIDLRIMPAVGIEKTAEWVFNRVNNYVRSTTEDRVEVIKVEVWEHEGNSAIYENDGAVYKNEYIPIEGLDYNVDPKLKETLPENKGKTLHELKEEAVEEEAKKQDEITAIENDEIKNEEAEKEEVKEEVKKEEPQPNVPPLNAPKSSGLEGWFKGTSWEGNVDGLR